VRGKLLKKTPSREQMLKVANDDVWLGALKYLNASDLLVFQCTSKHCKTLTDAPCVWDHIASSVFSLEATAVEEFAKNSKSTHYTTTTTTTTGKAVIASQSPKGAFFSKLQRYPYILMSLPHYSDRLLLVINRRLYDLTRFAEEHPGGYFILDQYKGRDASKPFELAHHSALAQAVAESLVVWDPVLYLGTEGTKKMPMFAFATTALSQSQAKG